METQTIKRKGITFQIDKETEDDYILYITEIYGITDEDLLNRWIEYHNKDSIEDTVYYIHDGHFDYLLKIFKDVEKLRDKYEEHSEDFEAITKYFLD